MACRTALLLALALVAVYAAPRAELSDSEYEYLFDQFKTEHGKSYTAELEPHKFSVFKDNLDFITDHNKNHADRLGYTVGINQFADMTQNEYKRNMLGYNALNKKPSPNVRVLDATAAPASVDWTTKGAVTPVKNQASCGSCWAFSTTGSIEGRVQIKSGKLTSLSEQDLVSCAGSFGNQGCNGGLMDDGFKFAKAQGLEKEDSYSYTAKTGTCNSAKEDAHDGLAPGTITGFQDVTPNSESQLAAAVAEGPVSVAIEADQSGFQFYKSGVFSGTCGTNLDHGVLVVGYGTDGGKDYWKVKNSWGATWGQEGYIMLAKGVSSAKGQCGVAAQPSYPVIGDAPAPGPSPPTPPTPPSPPTPTPTPTPSSGPYEAPPCASDEQPVQVQGLSGAFCSPSCTGGIFSKHCVAPPSGVAAKAQCILEASGSSSPTNCALVCSSDSECPKGGSCESIQGTGLCMFPQQAQAEVMRLSALGGIIDWLKRFLF